MAVHRRTFTPDVASVSNVCVGCVSHGLFTILESANVVQLTTEGFNYFPSMSHDRNWIVYESIDEHKPDDICKIVYSIDNLQLIRYNYNGGF